MLIGAPAPDVTRLDIQSNHHINNIRQTGNCKCSYYVIDYQEGFAVQLNRWPPRFLPLWKRLELRPDHSVHV